jgi:hypothetical protein
MRLRLSPSLTLLSLLVVTSFNAGAAEISGGTGVIEVAGGTGKIRIVSDFDSGSIGPYSIHDPASSDRPEDLKGPDVRIDFSLLTDGLDYAYWTHFVVSGVSGKRVTFRILNAEAAPFLSDAKQEAQLLYCEGGDLWQRFEEHESVEGIYSFTQAFTGNEVRIATFFPFSAERMDRFVDAAGRSPWATKRVLGRSHGGREIDLLTITNPRIAPERKKVIYILGRQHAAETCSSHMLEGMIDFLLSEDRHAAGLRDGFVWQIVPMANPDGVALGNSRANAEGNDPNRDWHPSNHDSVEVEIVRAHLDRVVDSGGVDMFLDWHSQMNDIGGYNFVYSPPGNTFFEILSEWSDFDVEKAAKTRCSRSSCTTRGYTSGYHDLLVFILEPTPHLVDWTRRSLRNEGVNTAFAINEYFDVFEGPLLVDGDFESTLDSAELRGDGGGPDWFESRHDDPGLLSLDSSSVAGNDTRKARLHASTTAEVYLTQRFGRPQREPFTVAWRICVESIVDLPGRANDRGGWMLIGDDSDRDSPGPNSSDGERFVCLAFSREGGGTSGETIDLVVRDRDDEEGAFTTLASGLTVGQWYRIGVCCDPAAGRFEVFLDGVSLGVVTSRHVKSRLTHISFAQRIDGAGSFLIDGP